MTSEGMSKKECRQNQGIKVVSINVKSNLTSKSKTLLRYFCNYDVINIYISHAISFSFFAVLEPQLVYTYMNTVHIIEGGPRDYHGHVKTLKKHFSKSKNAECARP